MCGVFAVHLWVSSPRCRTQSRQQETHRSEPIKLGGKNEDDDGQEDEDAIISAPVCSVIWTACVERLSRSRAEFFWRQTEILTKHYHRVLQWSTVHLENNTGVFSSQNEGLGSCIMNSGLVHPSGLINHHYILQIRKPSYTAWGVRRVSCHISCFCDWYSQWMILLECDEDSNDGSPFPRKKKCFGES